MDALAAQARVRNRVGAVAGLERQQVRSAAGADVSQATAFAQEAASRGGVGVLGAELGHVVR